MKKSKYLILSGLYFKFKEDLSEIDEVKKYFDTQNILDLIRFNELTTIRENKFENKYINFIYFSNNIETIFLCQFRYCKIKYINFSNCKKLNIIDEEAFSENQIRILKLPYNIKDIESKAFEMNNIECLDLSIYNSLNTIKKKAFTINNIKTLKLPNNLKIIEMSCFETNNITFLNLVDYINLKKIKKFAFSDNPLKEIKILNNIDIDYDPVYKDDLWTSFAIYYYQKNCQSGDYKYENNEWKWYPL